MKRYSLVASLALAVLVAMSLAGPTKAGDQVPFKGTFAGDVTVTPLVPPPSLRVDVEATGTSTHLGQFALGIPHIVDPRYGTAVGFYVLTAANGDTVFAEFTGLARPTAAPGILYIEETVTITGGTGRFAGATGSFTTERLYDRIAGTTLGSFEGTISSPGR